MVKKKTENWLGSVVIAVLVTLVPIAGFYTGTIPSRGMDASLAQSSIKFVLVISLWLILAGAAIAIAIANIRRLFARYGGNYNWATVKAIYRGRGK